MLAGVQNFAPPTILAQASRLNFSTRLFNLIVTNVPGPQFPLYVLGPRAPGPLPGRVPAREPRAGDRDHVLQRRLNFGLLGDYDALPDIEVIAAGIEDSLAELLEAGAPDRAERERGRGLRRTTARPRRRRPRRT